MSRVRGPPVLLSHRADNLTNYASRAAALADHYITYNVVYSGGGGAAIIDGKWQMTGFGETGEGVDRRGRGGEDGGARTRLG